jgi:GH15 family glucan-1,4-alpha-glucosidase
MEALERWADREYRRAASAMLASVSPVDIVKDRPGFGQRVVARRGSIVASPVCAAYDPDPDYFFHWYRDSAIVVEALRRLEDDGLEPRALEPFADFVRFSLALGRLDGRRLVEAPGWRAAIHEDFVRYLRNDEELSAVHGEAIAADTRVNPDGTLDISKWARPQHDGPALRALAVLRWTRSRRLDPELAAAAAALLRSDLAFTLARARVPCFDIWEEELGLHYFTLRVAAAALEEGADWLDAEGEPREAAACRDESARLLVELDGYWLPELHYYRSRVLASGLRSRKELDISVVLAALQAGEGAARHSAGDPRMHATLERLEALFDEQYPINHGRPAERAPAMGRYAQDRYYSGGAYYFSTLGAAELCYRAAIVCADPPPWMWTRRGDAFLETVRAFTPASGDLSEQFDRTTGAQTSAKHLAWSYAAFITCLSARKAAARRAHPGS